MSLRRAPAIKAPKRTILSLERLDERIVPYAVSGYKWASVNVTASFMPDGTTTDGGLPSNLMATLNASFAPATWQREFARALQTWADVSPLNFHFVSDNGAAAGSTGSSQGDTHFGDIRLGGYASSTWAGYTYFPAGGTLGGDEFLSTTVAWKIGTYPDLYSIFLHESGHAIGLDHSLATPAVMRASISTVFSGLYADDISGSQAIYGVRPADAYDTAASNNSLATATTLSLNGAGAASISADLTSMADLDYYKVTAPVGGDGTLTASVDARNLSLFQGKVSVYDAAGSLVGTATAATYGDVATLSLTGLTPGQAYTIGVSGATTDPFGMGAYKLNVAFGGITALPTVSIGNVAQTEGNSGTTAFTFNVTLSAASTNIVTVQYATANGTATTAGSDYTAASGTVTFAPGETLKTVTVAVTGDTTVEADETFSVTLTSPTNATLGTSLGTGTIRNDDLGADRYEANNTSAVATNFGSTNAVSQAALTLHTTTDGDYYRFTPTKKSTFKVTVTPTQGAGTLDLVVLNSAQTVLASGLSTTGAITLTLNLTAATTYYIKARSSSGSLFMYNLDVVKTSGGPAQLHEIGDGTELAPIRTRVSPLRTPTATPAAVINPVFAPLTAMDRATVNLASDPSTGFNGYRPSPGSMGTADGRRSFVPMRSVTHEMASFGSRHEGKSWVESGGVELLAADATLDLAVDD